MSALRNSARKALPPDYRLVRRLEIGSRRTFILLNVGSVGTLAVGALFFFGVDRLLVALNITPWIDVPLNSDTQFAFSILAIVMVILMLSFHEVCHGLAFRAFGAQPHYGINWRKAVAYARADQYYLPRNAYIVTALAPLIVISLLTVIVMALTGGGLRSVVALTGSANVGGAVGDLWFTAVCLRYPRRLLVRDFGEGAELFTAP